MKLKLKKGWSDVNMSSPISGILTNLAFLDPDLYIHWWSRGVKEPFEIVKEVNEAPKPKTEE